MQAEFDTWNEQKKSIHNIQQCPMFKEREVWWCSLGANVGDEQNGKGSSFTRPVLVLKKFNRNLFLGVPMSTKIKDNKFYHRISFREKEQSALLSQIKVIDAKRLKDKMGEITGNEMAKLKQVIRELVL